MVELDMNAVVSVAISSITVLNLIVAILLLQGLQNETIFHECTKYISPDPPVTWPDVGTLLKPQQVQYCKNLLWMYVKHDCIRSAVISDDTEILEIVSHLAPKEKCIYLSIERTYRKIAPILVQMSIIFVLAIIVFMLWGIIEVGISALYVFYNRLQNRQNLLTEKEKNHKWSYFPSARRYLFATSAIFLISAALCALTSREEWDSTMICSEPYCLYSPFGLKNTIFKSLEIEESSWFQVFQRHSRISLKSLKYGFNELITFITTIFMSLTLYIITADLVFLIIYIPIKIMTWALYRGKNIIKSNLMNLENKGIYNEGTTSEYYAQILQENNH